LTNKRVLKKVDPSVEDHRHCKNSRSVSSCRAKEGCGQLAMAAKSGQFTADEARTSS